MLSSDFTKKVQETLDDLNNEYGQDKPIRLYHKTMDIDGFHFEFGNIFGLAYYHADNPDYSHGEMNSRVLLISEDDDFWRVRDNVVTFSPAWIKSIENVTKRMEKYIKEHYPEEIKY